MASPKSKISKSRRGMRRAHNSLDASATSKCTNCDSAITPHRVCPSCGFYKGKLVLNK